MGVTRTECALVTMQRHLWRGRGTEITQEGMTDLVRGRHCNVQEGFERINRNPSKAGRKCAQGNTQSLETT